MILAMTDSDANFQAPPQIQFDAGSHSRAKIGYALLATEQTVQDDLMRLCPPGVGVHCWKLVMLSISGILRFEVRRLLLVGLFGTYR